MFLQSLGLGNSAREAHFRAATRIKYRLDRLLRTEKAYRPQYGAFRCASTLTDSILKGWSLEIEDVAFFMNAMPSAGTPELGT